MPYRGHLPGAPDLDEHRELLALAKAAKLRRLRAALTLGSLGVALGSFACAMGRGQPRTEPICHHVKIVLQQSLGVPPPPMEWTTCRDAHDLPGNLERIYHDLPQL
jgi:hypothetical protein